MSHVTEVKLKIRDLGALEEACDALGLEFRRDQKTHAWWGTFAGDSTPPPGRDPAQYGKCEHAIGLKGVPGRNGSSGNWEIGVVKSLDGDGYTLMLDEFGGAGQTLMDPCGGRGLPRLKQEYAAATTQRVATDRLSRRGFSTERETLANGTIRLRLTRR